MLLFVFAERQPNKGEKIAVIKIKMLDKYNLDFIIIAGFAPRPTRRKASGGVIFLWGEPNAF